MGQQAHAQSQVEMALSLNCLVTYIFVCDLHKWFSTGILVYLCKSQVWKCFICAVGGMLMELKFYYIMGTVVF